MNTISLKKRIILTLSLLIAFFLIQAFVTRHYIEQTKETLTQSTTKQAIVADQLGDLAVRAQQIRRYEKEYFVYVGVADKRASYEKNWTEAYTKIATSLVAMKSNSNQAFTTADVQQIDKWIAAAKFYESEMRTVFTNTQTRAALVADKQKEADEAAAVAKKGKKTASTETEPIPKLLSSTDVNDMISAGKDRFSNDLIKGLETMTKAKVVSSLTMAEQANESFQNLLFAILATVGAGVLVALVMIAYLPKAIAQPIDALSADVDRISLGDMDAPVTAQSVVEFKKLEEAIERLRTAQQMLVKRLRA
jgi:methyl-accepting chemotaxis protein